MRLVPTSAYTWNPSFFRWLLERVPWWRMQMAIEISDAIWNTAKEVLESKKAALAAGEEAVSAQVGEGKDIISVLCMSILFFLFLEKKPRFDFGRSEISNDSS